MDRYRCRECGTTNSLPAIRAGKQNRCRECDARLPEEPLPPSHGNGLVIGLIAGGLGLGLLALIGVGVLVYLFVAGAKPAPNGPNVAQQGEPPPPFGQPKVDMEQPKGFPPPPPLPPPPPDRKDFGPPPVVDGPKDPFPPLPIKPIDPGATTLQLPALPPPIDITPTKLTAATDVNLPEKVERTVVGGGGRYLVMHFPKLRKLGLFDVCEAKISKYIDVAEDRIYFAAGMTKLIVVLPTAGMIQRYDLSSGTREALQAFEFPGVNALAMGHSSAGPLVVRGTSGSKLYDPASFTEIPLPSPPFEPRFPGDRGQPRVTTLPFEGGDIWAAGNGRAFGNTGNYGQPNGIRVVSLEGGQVKLRSEHKGTWFVQPSPDGKYVFAGGHDPANGELRASPDVIGDGLSQVSGHMAKMFVPAHHGPYYAQFHNARWNTPGQPGDKQNAVKIYLYGLKTPVVSIPFDQPGGGDPRGDRDYVTVRYLPTTLHVIPRANLVILPGEDKLRLVPVNLEKELAQSGAEFLVVTTAAPTQYQPGKLFTYTIKAISKAGKIQFKLQSGPEGMTVDNDGEVHWRVPADFKQPASVIISLNDAGGKEAFHNFTLTAEGGATPVPPVGNPNPPPPPPPPPPVVDGKDDLGWPAAPTRVPLKPTVGKERLTVTLPEKASRAVLGGDGRFLVLHFANLRKLGLFDLNEQKINKYIDVAEDRILMAASMNKLVVYLPSAKILQRYDLLTGEREALQPYEPVVKGLAMGHASAGPLALATQQGGKFLDLATFKEIPLPMEDNPDRFGGPAKKQMTLSFTTERLEASANGRFFAGGGDFQTGSVSIEGNSIKRNANGRGFGDSWIFMRPSSDGKYIFRGGLGAVTSDGRTTGDVVYSADHNGYFGHCYLPAAHGPFYFHVGGGVNPHQAKATAVGGLTIYMYGLKEEISVLTTVHDTKNMESALQGLPFAERFHMIPRGRAVVTVDRDTARLTIVPFEPYEALEAKGSDFLFVTSQPPGSFEPSKPFQYPLEVRSKAGGVQFKVETGPAGMRVDAQGVVAWDVPAAPPAEVSVIISVKDKAGKEAFHTFRLLRSGASIPASKDPGPKPKPVDPKLPKLPPPPAVVIPWPDPPEALPITPSALTVRTEVNARMKFETVIPAGGGRYLLLHSKSQKRLLTFDVVSGKIERTTDLEAAETCVAAGMLHYYVGDPAKNEIHQYDVQTGTLVKRHPVATKNITELQMGSASRGPLYVRTATSAELYDTATMRPMTLPKETPAGFPFKEGPVWVAPNGRLIANVTTDGTTKSVRTATLEVDQIRTYFARTATEWDFALPRADGQAVYIAECGGFAGNLERLTTPVLSVARLDQPGTGEYHLRPAETGTLYMNVLLGKKPRLFTGSAPPTYGVTLHQGDPFRAFEAIAIPELEADKLRAKYVPQMLHYVPQANVVLYIPATKDRVLVYPTKNTPK